MTNINELTSRVEIFDDSKSMSDSLSIMAEKADKPMDSYVMAQAAIQICGLYELAVELAKALEAKDDNQTK